MKADCGKINWDFLGENLKGNSTIHNSIDAVDEADDV